MEHILYWIWLTSKNVINSGKITSLLENFSDIEEIYEAKSYKNIKNIGDKEEAALKDKSLNEAKHIYDETKRIGAFVVTYDDEAYPEKLRNIVTPPYILYVKGEMIDFDKYLTIGVVGTRKNTPYGKLVTHRIAGELAKEGVIIVSGMARGIDSIAARAALRSGNKTVAVLGSGLDVVYPPENADLMEEISRNGLIITEYPLGTPAYKTNFPERNRIIAGLSNGVLVAEAPRRSGSLITARFALENGRDVFSVPGSIFEPNYEGSNRIIQQYAKLVTKAYDVIEEYPYAKKTEIVEKSEASKEEVAKNKTVNIEENEKFKNLSDDEKKIVSLLMNNDMLLDELSRRLNVEVSEMNVKMTLLEMKGAVKKLPGNVYQIIV